MSEVGVVTGFENISMIELDQSSLACTVTKHRTEKFEVISQHYYL